MDNLKTWCARVTALLRRDRLEREMREEMAFHLEMLAADRTSQGLPEKDARAGARREFGNVSLVTEHMRDGWSVGFEHLWRDARYAARALRRAPGFSLVSVTALALGIGATTAIVSVVDRVVLQPLPYTEPERLVMVWEDLSRVGFPRNTPAPGNYLSWRQSAGSFAGLAATRGAQANLTSGGAPEQVLGRRVTANFFEVLGVRPDLGRTFSEEEDRDNAPVTLISHQLWQRRYAGDANIIGREILMSGERRTVIGVMPATFMFRSRDVDFWTPMAFTVADAASRNSHFLNVVGRLAPGGTIAAANAELRTIAAQLMREYPGTNTDVGALAEPLRSDLLGRAQLQLLVLLGGAACVLLIACANVAGLLLSRNLTRRSELAIRVSLGATTRAIVRQLVVEAMLLALTGALLGVAIAPLGIRLITGLVPTSMPVVAPPSIDLRLLGLAVTLAVSTGLLFSAVPALHAARAVVVGEELQQAGRSGVGLRSRLSRDGLVVIQVAAALALLIDAGLLLRTFDELRGRELGFRSDHLVTMRTPLPNPEYSDPASRMAFYDRVVDNIRRLPGVADAAFVSMLPFASTGFTTSYRVDGRPDDVNNDALYRASTHGYLQTLGATLREGRLLDERDGRYAPLAVVINETFAEHVWPGASPLGARVRFGGSSTPLRTVIGVIRDVRERGFEPDAKPAAYVAWAQQVSGWYPDNLVVRSQGDVLEVVPAVRQVIAAVDPEQPVAAVRAMQDLVDSDVVDRRDQTVLLSLFAGLALALAALGLYGVLAHAVSQRRREIAVRVALGATRANVVGAVAGRGQLLIGAGLVIGLSVAWIGSRLLQTLLVGVDSTDPVTFLSAIAVLWVVSLLASSVPAYRAVRVDPAVVLRDE